MIMYVNITYRRGEVSNKGVQGRWLPDGCKKRPKNVEHYCSY